METSLCPRCRHENPGAARYCAACGRELGRDTSQQTPASLNFIVSGDTGSQATSVIRLKGISPWSRWFTKGLAVLVLLFTIAALLGTYFAGAIAAGLGVCIWVVVTGKWPDTSRSVNPVVRLLLSLFPLAVNGFIAFVIGWLYGSDCDICGDSGIATGSAIGVIVFVVSGAIETIVVLLVTGALKLHKYLWHWAD